MNEKLDSTFVMGNRIVQHTVNGLSRFLILWIINEKGPINGYTLMKEIDAFYDVLINKDSIKKSRPSKVYPILKMMEEHNLITGTERVLNNKKVIFYRITEQGEFLLFFIRDSFLKVRNSPNTSLFFDDFLKNV